MQCSCSHYRIFANLGGTRARGGCKKCPTYFLAKEDRALGADNLDQRLMTF